MNARAVILPPAATTLRTQATAAWRAMPPRERIAASVGVAVLVSFVVWLILIAPAVRSLRAAPPEIDRLDAQLQYMQRLAADVRSLTAAPPVSAAQAAQPLKLATERLGERASLTLQGDRATLLLRGISGDALRDWMSEIRSSARARPVAVQLTRGTDGFSGRIEVTLGSGS